MLVYVGILLIYAAFVRSLRLIFTTYVYIFIQSCFCDGGLRTEDLSVNDKE